MIGLVFVCHSARLAEGVAELAAQMGGGNLKLVAAGGLDQPGGALGTDARLVARAIAQAWSEDGVLVLMDLGSAVLSAEMALELLPEEQRGRVLLTEAPLVEGAVAAAVAAGLGETLEKVAEEACGGLAAKVAHLAQRAAPGPLPQAAAAQPPVEPPPDGLSAAAARPPSLRVVVPNRLGLHARPAALFVRTAARFDADIAVANVTANRGPVSARSLNAVATLGVRCGHEILVQASGPQAEEALAAIRRLANENFGDPPEAGRSGAADAKARPALPVGPAAASFPAPPARAGLAQTAGGACRPSAGSVLHGLPASPGIAVGRARWLRDAPVDVPDGPAQDPQADWAALQEALATVRRDIGRTRDSVAGLGSDYDAAIFDAHLLFLEDEALLGPARDSVLRRGTNAGRAWADAVSSAAAAWEALEDPYLQARAVDLRDVGQRVLRHLLGLPSDSAAIGAGIVVAPDLAPAQIVALDRSRVRGLTCALGGPTSHAAILARSLGIPAVVGVGQALLAVRESTPLVLDGETGTVTVDPPTGALRAARIRRAQWRRREAAARERAHLPALTRDGFVVHVAANVAGREDVRAAVAGGADGVGLLRTELVFLEAERLPTENEHVQAYRAIAEELDGRQLTVRTLDVGADKQLPYLPLAQEQNPSLGLRGIRVGLGHPELLTTQLRAVLRVGADHPVRVMLPMVTMVDEVQRARVILEEARASLDATGISVPRQIEVGIMVEVPAAALCVEAFLPHVDFFSLGTNDLAQYVLAADRGNTQVAALADALHPAVLRLIDLVAQAAVEAGRRVAVCGEVAGDPLAIPLLLGLGVDELSMTPDRIPLAKQTVRATDLGLARKLARKALATESAAAVRRLGSAVRA